MSPYPMTETFTVSDRHRDIVDLVIEAAEQIKNAECGYDVVITLPDGWKLRLLYDMASSGGLVCIDGIETPTGELINDDNMEQCTWWWLQGFVEGLNKE